MRFSIFQAFHALSAAARVREADALAFLLLSMLSASLSAQGAGTGRSDAAVCSTWEMDDCHTHTQIYATTHAVHQEGAGHHAVEQRAFMYRAPERPQQTKRVGFGREIHSEVQSETG